IIGNTHRTAAVGELHLPQFNYIFSDSFAGCVFFLFRQGNVLFGVHSFRENGKCASPIPYFTRLGAKLLYYFDTKDQFTPLGADVFGAVICYVTPTRIAINWFGYEGREPNFGRVVGVVQRTAIDNWTNTSILDPDLAGDVVKLQVAAAPLQPPAK